ncbi:MAG TPA: acyltransferase family protein [Nitrospira sp.]
MMLITETPIGRISATPAENSIASVQVEHSCRFDVLRVVACLAVILLHLAATIVRDHEFVGTLHWHVSNAINAATSWCVPMFVMLSGALLLNPSKHKSFRDFWAKRMNRLLPALIAWSAIYFVWRTLYWHEPVSLSVIAHDVSVGQPYIHLYFLFLIAGLYLVTPFLAKAVTVFSQAQLRNLTLIIAGLALTDSLPGLASVSAGSALTMFVPYLAYYIAGWYCAKVSLEQSPVFLWITAGAAGITTIVTALLVSSLGIDDRRSFYFYGSFSPTVMMMAIGLFLFIMHTRIPPWLGSAVQRLAPLTLGAYVVHPIVVELLRYGYFVWSPSLLLPPYYIPLTFLLTCALAFPLIALMQRVPGLKRIV